MCLIIHKPNKDSIIPDEYIDNAEDINPDGFGIVYTDTNECVRTMDYNYARELILAERPFVAHYRYATRGAVSKPNCHPYHIQDYIRLFSNGTVGNLGDNELCDTNVVASYLKNIPTKYWQDLLSMTETRFAITHPDGTVERHGTWHEKDGVFYSKNNCFFSYKSSIGYHYNSPYSSKGYNKTNINNTDTNTAITKTTSKLKPIDDYDDFDDFEDEAYPYSFQDATLDTSPESFDESVYDWQDINLIAVYGTLKAGHGNHKLMEGTDTEYLGSGVTVNKYAMQIQGVPYVFKNKSYDQIDVEVYSVPDNNERVKIDSLESHPYHYKRELIDIELLDGSTVTAWLYFGDEAFYDPYNTNVRSY